MLLNIEQIQELNSHWGTTKVSPCHYELRRTIYSDCLPWLESRQIITLQGLRRTGKSVLLEQLRDQYLQKHNLPAQNLLNFSFDHDDFDNLLPASLLEEVLRFYFARVRNSAAKEITSPTLICLDEIQNVSEWQSVVKRYYDLNPNFKFLISGSSSLYLKDTSESLVGRVIDFDIQPFSFREFLDFSGRQDLITASTLDSLTTMLPQIVTQERLELFNAFLVLGGFPESTLMLKQGRSASDVQKYIRNSIVQKILTKDLKKYFNLTSSIQDLQLFKVICNETGSVINYKNIAKNTNLDEEFVSKHLKVFGKASLVNLLFRYDTKLRKTINSHPKIYTSSPCIAMAFLGHQEVPVGSLTGHLVEGYVYDRLRNLMASSESAINYVNPTQNSEIDFCLPNERLLIECKYSEQIPTNLRENMQELGSKYNYKPLIITKQDWGDINLSCIPACFL